MDLPANKAPPRYVPTLTEVVTEPDEAGVAPPLPGPEAVALSTPMAPAMPAIPVTPSAPPAPAMPASRYPLAETVLPNPADEEEPEPGPELDAAAWAQVQMQAEERLVQRLLERVEGVLDQRLRESIAQVVQEQTRSLTLRLQEELESVLRQTVQEALAQERASHEGAASQERR